MREKGARMGILLIGMGNILKGDDGLGVHALRRLAEEGVEGAELLELGTSLSDCFSLLEGYECVIALDAVAAGGDPGSLYWLSEERFARMRGRGLSLHEGDLLDALDLAALRGRKPELRVAGMEPLEWGNWSMELSPPVLAAMPDYLAMIRTRLSELIGV